MGQNTSSEVKNHPVKNIFLEPESQLPCLEGSTVGVCSGPSQCTSLCHIYFMCSTVITSFSSWGILICHISSRFSETIYYTFCIYITFVECLSNLVQIFSKSSVSICAQYQSFYCSPFCKFSLRKSKGTNKFLNKITFLYRNLDWIEDCCLLMCDDL